MRDGELIGQEEGREERESEPGETRLVHPGERVDDLERSHLRIIQNPARFCFGMDAVLLSGFAKAPAGGSVLDLGAGTGIIPILMSAKTAAGHFDALEIQPESADMARRSVLLDHLEDRITVTEGDIRQADVIFTPASFDTITSNPPYLAAGHGLTNPTDTKAIARHEILCTFDDIARVSAHLLKPAGHLYLVHRPFRLVELFDTLTHYHLEPKRMRLVYPYIDKAPNMVLLDCIRDANRRITMEKPLIVYKAPGQYTDEIYDIYGY